MWSARAGARSDSTRAFSHPKGLPPACGGDLVIALARDVQTRPMAVPTEPFIDFSQTHAVPITKRAVRVWISQQRTANSQGLVYSGHLRAAASIHARRPPRRVRCAVHQNFPARSVGRAAVWTGLYQHRLVPTNRLTAAGDIPDTGIPPGLASGMTMAEQYDWHQDYLRRHSVSRRNFLRGSAALAAVAAGGFHRSVAAPTRRMRRWR